ncbi:MAG: porin [Hyphomonas sp.]|uniref:porin n=1 Tax=Hyphomonas sp. TaxID=87 RepID=UPI00352752BA
MDRLAISLAFLGVVALPAAAQDVWEEESLWETGVTGEAALVASPGEDDETLLRFGIGAFANRVLDNGLEIGVVTGVRFERDHPARAGFSGILAAPAGQQPPVIGAFSGLAAAAVVEDAGARGAIETAYVYAEGGYGEIRLGRDEGIAKRFSEGAPSVFRTLSLHAPQLDPGGVALVRTDHDLTGPSAKVSVATPRIIGLRGGLSFTPEASTRGLDRDPARIFPGAPAVSIRNAAEASLSFNHRFRATGLRTRASVAYSHADVDAAPTSPVDYDSVTTLSAGGSLEWEGFVLGGSMLDSDNGLADTPGDYTAWTAGLSRELFGIRWGFEYGEAEDDTVQIDGKSWRFGGAKAFGDHAAVALGYRSDTVDLLTGAHSLYLPDSEGIVLEITLSR